MAVFGILGVCFWIYQWYRSDGNLAPTEIADILVTLAAQGYRARQRRGRR
jgi:TetR/AcrR family transcriptional regulator, cholesterol catabolism regulator